MKKILFLLFVVSVCFLVGCDEDDNSTNDSSNDVSGDVSGDDSNDDLNEDSNETILLEFNGIIFEDKTVSYDGTPHTIEVSGAPDFASITYFDAGPFINAGEYVLKAKISADGYKDLNLTAKLTINKIDLNEITFVSQSFDYDGIAHSISIEGNLPAGTNVTYSSDVEGVTNSATEIGVYNITATITSLNFNDLILTAKLTINATDEQRYMKVSGNTLFFQNAIDQNKLYAYNFENESLVKVSNDVALDIEIYNDDSVMFISKTLLLSSVKTASYDEKNDTTSVSSVLNKGVRYIQFDGENILYFVINGLTNNKSGIYKADFSGEEPVVTLLSVGKAKYLKLYDSTLYFADGNNDYKLSKINTVDENQTRILLLDEKVNNMELIDGVLYFNIDTLLGDYIAKYTISNGVCRKLTQDAGINFTVIDGELYYINIDKLSSTIYGNGIYKVNSNPLFDNSLSGTKVVDGGELGVCSLSSNDDYLLYYEVEGYKLIQYSTVDETKTNLLDEFTKPVDPTPTSFGSQVCEANGIIYYLDIYDEKTLHSYNPVTNENYRLTSEKVDNFSIVGDYIYFNMVTYGLNNDTYRMNYITGSTLELINSYDSTDLVSDGTFIYYVERNVSGAATSIHKANMDGTNDIIIFNYAADNLVLHNGTLYFVAKPLIVQTIMKIEDVANVTEAQEKVCVNDDYACDVFTIENDVIYFRQNYGLSYKNHRLAKMNIDGTGYSEIVSTATDPTEIIVLGEYVYYANSAETSSDYDLYRVSINGTDGSQQKLTDGMYASSICIHGEKMYFINYYLGGTLGDSHLYSVSVNGGEVNLIA